MQSRQEVFTAEVNRKVPTKSALYDAMLRNGWYLPHKKSQIITVDYLLGVKDRRFFCPKYEDIRLRPCPLPPTKAQVVHEVFLILDKDCNLGFSEADHHKVDTTWALNILSSIQPDHEFFGKSFVPHIPSRSEEIALLNENDAAFLDGLPDLSQLKKFKCKKSTLSIGKVKSVEQRRAKEASKAAQSQYVSEAQLVKVKYNNLKTLYARMMEQNSRAQKGESGPHHQTSDPSSGTKCGTSSDASDDDKAGGEEMFD